MKKEILIKLILFLLIPLATEAQTPQILASAASDGPAARLVTPAEKKTGTTIPLRVVCPLSITVSCDAPTDPAQLGLPLIQGNITPDTSWFEDVRLGNCCPYSYDITRNWTVIYNGGNAATCSQYIQVRDATPPTLVCPPDVTVACDITPVSTGIPLFSDNCDAGATLVHPDRIVGGDCGWVCHIERSWSAMDICGNTAVCVQKIEKSVLPLLMNAMLNGAGGTGSTNNPIVLGSPLTNTTLTIDLQYASCILDWFPYRSGAVPTGLESGQQRVDADCRPGTNPLDADHHLANPLLAEALKLTLYLRLHTAYGNKKLSELNLPCSIAPLVLQALAQGKNSTVNELMRNTHIALSNNGPLVMSLNELLSALQCINGTLNFCDAPN